MDNNQHDAPFIFSLLGYRISASAAHHQEVVCICLANSTCYISEFTDSQTVHRADYYSYNSVVVLVQFSSFPTTPHFSFHMCLKLTLCGRVVNLIQYRLVPGRFKFFECSTPKCTVTYILTL
jgi:hypothetical protein